MEGNELIKRWGEASTSMSRGFATGSVGKAGGNETKGKGGGK